MGSGVQVRSGKGKHFIVPAIKTLRADVVYIFAALLAVK